MHSPPTPSTLSKCFPPSSSRTITFVGDSVVRQLFFASAKIADPSLPGTPDEAGGEKHSDRELEAVLGEGKGQLKFEFWW
jgi:hypothetical protein